jgi:type I restriction enzyme S subunit
MNKQDDKRALMPKLRFPKFRDSPGWEARELGAMTTKVGSGITPTGGDRNYKTKGRPFVRSQNVGWGQLILDDIAFIDEETHTSFDSTEIKELDVLLNITGASIGRCAVADERIAGGNVNQHVCILRVKPNELNQVFLNQYLISQYGQKQIDSFQAGGNRQGLNFAQIRSFLIPVPPTDDEQKQVATCLSSIDDLITAQTKKLEALKIHRKGLMQQLFPRKGESTPRLRFSEFQSAGEWVENRLEKIGRVIRGSSPRPQGDSRYYGGPVPRLMVQDVTRDGKWVTPRIDSLTEEGAKLSRPCPAGTLTIVCSGNVGVVSFLAVDACIHDGFLALIDIDESIMTKDFIFHSLSTLREQFEKGANHGGVFTNLTTTSIGQFGVMCPLPPQQNKIAACLTTLDEAIFAQTQKVKALKTHKKGLMQKLFPCPEEVES